MIEPLFITKKHIFVEKNQMANYIEYDCFAYIASLSTMQARIAAIDVVIDNNIILMGQQTASQAGGTNMYELDDGQIRIKVIYRSVKEILAINIGLEQMQQMYIRRLNGSATVLRDKRTFRGGLWGGGCNC